MKLIYPGLLLGLSLLLSCTKNSNDSEPETVYVAGSNMHGAVLWKNGIGYPLDGLFASSLAVSPYAEYVAGYAQKDVGTVSRFWRSGSPVALTDGSDTGYRLNPNGYFPNFISSFDHDIYVAGYIRAGNNVTAVYWKNSQAVRFMEDSTHSSVAQSIVESANTIAILGLLDGNPNYWQNGIPHKLESNGQSVGATGIAVSGSDVYVSGSDGSPIYWKNGNPVSLNDTFKYSFPTSVFVAGSDVYVAGYGEAGNYTFYMIYWKNGVPHTLGKGQAFSIAVSGDNVYVAGYASGTNETQAIYYKNGQPVKLGDSDGSVAYSIAVLPLK